MNLQDRMKQELSFFYMTNSMNDATKDEFLHHHCLTGCAKKLLHQHCLTGCAKNSHCYSSLQNIKHILIDSPI